MGWNGLDLVNDFSSELGDTSSAFKTKVLRWINEGIKDIATSHQWPFLREKGKVVLTAGQDTHALPLAKPLAPTVTAIAGGSLALTYEYKVLITFYEGFSGVESVAGVPSAGIIPVGTDLQIELTNIPVSSSPLVTSRRVYLSKGGGAFAYYGEINNNLVEIPEVPAVIDPATGIELVPAVPAIPITFTVSSDTNSQITPPEENAVFMIDGDLFLENNRILIGTSIQDLVFTTNGYSSNGTPSRWAPINEVEIQVYPKPSVNTTASFFYFKYPAKVFGTTTSVPQMPSWLYDDLRRYVLWRGYDFRDRAGKESKEITYRENLKLTISRKGKAIKKSGRVRCVTPDSDGYGI